MCFQTEFHFNMRRSDEFESCAENTGLYNRIHKHYFLLEVTLESEISIIILNFQKKLENYVVCPNLHIRIQ